MELIKKKLGVLSNLEFDKLFLAQIFSHFSDAIVQFLLVAVLMGLNASGVGKSIAIVFFSFLLPQFLLSPFTGAVCDRISRKAILFLSCLYRFLIVLVLVFSINSLTNPLIYSFSFALGIGAAFFYPAKMSAVTNIVKSSQLKFANALNSSIGAIALLLGAIGADFLNRSFGLKISLIIIACAYFSGAFVSFLIKFLIPQKFNKTKSKNDFKIAFLYLKNHKKALYLVGLAICLQFIVAAFSNSLNALVVDYYNLTFGDLTILRTILGAGMVAGMFLTVYFARIMRIPHLFACGFGVLCIALLTAPFCSSIKNSVFWLVPIGMAYAVVAVMLDTILQKAAPDRVRGKIFGLTLTFSTLSFLTGTFLVSQIVNIINPLNIFKLIALLSFSLLCLVLIFDKSFRYFLLKATLGHIFLLLFKYKVEGIENIPKYGKVILAGNHTGHLDPFIIQMATHRQLWFVTGPAAFKMPVIKHLLKYFNVLPLKFGKGLDAISSAVKKLQAGEAVIIFPEGKFSPDGNLCKFNRGVGLMALEADCTIVPFAIKGGFESWGGNRIFPKLFNNIIIQFGEAISDFDNKNEKQIALELRSRVSFIKNSLERRAFYNINQRQHNNFLDLMQEKGDIYAQTKALSLKTKNGFEEMSYLELSRNAKRFANYLIENTSIEKNDRIAIISESRPEFGLGMFASIQTGAITVPLDIKLTVSEHSHILNDCKPKFLLTSSHYLAHALEVKNNVDSIEKIFVLDDENIENQTDFDENILFVSKLESDIEKNIAIPRSLDETALIVYTSGTTGNPKGVMISFGNIYSQLKDFEDILKLSNKNTLLSILPLNHLLELNVGFFGMLYMGAKIVYIQSLSPKELTSVMKEKKITNMIIVPLVAKMLKNSIEKEIKRQKPIAQNIFKFMYKIAKFVPRSTKRLMFKSIIEGLGGKLECFVCGGAPLEDDVAEFFDRIGIPAFQGYGLTETSPVISTNRYKNSKLGTVGKPLPSVKVKTLETGEIIAKGPNVMQGYWQKPEMTREVIDEDGWFHTGDIGEIDNQGFVKITGRIKNMIVLGGGKKIFPEEVEAVLETSDLIKELCVLSLTIKQGNKKGTEEVGAIVVPCDSIIKKDDCEIQKLLEEEIKTLCAKNLAPYKAPTVVVIHREELPKTSTRKVKRNELKKWYENHE